MGNEVPVVFVVGVLDCAEPQHLLQIHDGICTAARISIDKKNSDYSPADDALRTVGQFGRLGVLVRLSDKMGRLRTLVESGKVPAVGDESERDTVMDAINYLVLYRALTKEEQSGQQDSTN